MLLSAQAAQLSGDEKAASKFFVKMSERKDTKYLGIHGMLNQAIQDGDKVVALELAEQANDLHPKTDKVSKALFELQVQSGNWLEAEETVRKAVKDKYLDIDVGRRRRAAIFYQRSTEAESNGNLNEALTLAKKANNLTSGFVPAAVRTARLLQGAGKRRKAVSIIEEIWVTNPHPLLIDVIGELSSGAGAQEKMRTVEQLASYNKDHLESHLAITRFALLAEMWQEAREHLNAASAGLEVEAFPARICRYLAELEERENHDLELSREWLKKAAIAEPDSAWNCNHCGQVVADWNPICKYCKTFDSLEWRTPPRVTRMSQGDNNINTPSSGVNDVTLDDSAKTIDIEPNVSS
jgi:HemY protein